MSYAADCHVIVCYDAAKRTDKHLAATVHCVDDEIIEWLKRREQRGRGKTASAAKQKPRQPVRGDSATGAFTPTGRTLGASSLP